MLRASEKRILIEPEHSSVSIVQQCDLLGLARSSYYYEAAQENTENLRLMDALDRLYMDYPFFGVERMTIWLRHEGWVVNPKRIRRLLRLMGLEALAPKPNTSLPNKEHRIYPYMLRDMAVTHPNMVPRRRGVCRYYVYSSSGRLDVPCRGDGLVQSLRAGMGTLEQHGNTFLLRCSGAGVALRATADIQHRPRSAVYQQCFYAETSCKGYLYQHGWARTGVGQCLY